MADAGINQHPAENSQTSEPISNFHRHGAREEKLEARQQLEIEYLYLDFETQLPTPFRTSTSHLDGSPPPSCPNLKQFTSPFNWTNSRKTMITWLACAATFLAAYAPGSYNAAMDQLTSRWNVSQVVYTTGITVFTTSFALAPMVLAPFSEINGRRPVFLASGVLFTACLIASGGTNSFGGMIAARLFLGVGGSTFSTMVGGVISDIYHAEDRNAPMALFSGAALIGTGVGPLIGSVIAQHTTWRWIFYTHAIASGVVLAIMYLVLQETRGSILLSRKARALNAYYEQLEEAGYHGVLMPSEEPAEKQTVRRIRWKVKADEERESLAKMVRISCTRPFLLLVTEPVVFFFSLWISFSWAVLYLQFGSIPLVFQTSYGFDLQESGAVFTAMAAGALLATVLSIYQERIAMRFGKLSSTPEGRLYFACIESALLPVGLFWFGWTSFPSVPWIVPALAVGCATVGIFSIYLAVFNYLSDTYHRYASSALAAQSCCRNLLGGVFPLITKAMFRNLGTPAASSLLGGIGALLTLVPWVLVFYGTRIRARSKIASELLQQNHT